MKKLFVSVPMKGRTEEEIKKSIQKMKKIAEAYVGEELELIDSYVGDKPPVDVSERVWYLGRSIEKLSEADVFIGIRDDYEFDGCYTERVIAERYGIERISVDAFWAIENFREYYKQMFPGHNELSSEYRMKLPIIIAKDLKKGIIGMRNIKLGGFDVAIVWLKKKYETGTVFEIKDIDKVDVVLHFADKESLDVTIGILEKIKRDWR